MKTKEKSAGATNTNGLRTGACELRHVLNQPQYTPTYAAGQVPFFTLEAVRP